MRNKIYWISLDQHHFRSETRAHLHNWRYECKIQPSLQVKSLRILLRFPFYTDETWFTLLFPQKLILATYLRLASPSFNWVNELLSDEHAHFTMPWLLKYWTPERLFALNTILKLNTSLCRHSFCMTGSTRCHFNEKINKWLAKWKATGTISFVYPCFWVRWNSSNRFPRT